jgi:hypothetical protein
MQEERIKCIVCKNMILSQTATRHSGLCKPCFKRKLLDDIGRTPFGKAYKNAFKRPALKTSRYCFYWLDLSERLAGPLYDIRTGGDCSAIFQNKTGLWAGISNIDDLQKWCLEHVVAYRKHLSQTASHSKDEKLDQQMLLNCADRFEETVILAMEHLRNQV